MRKDNSFILFLLQSGLLLWFIFLSIKSSRMCVISLYRPIMKNCDRKRKRELLRASQAICYLCKTQCRISNFIYIFVFFSLFVCLFRRRAVAANWSCYPYHKESQQKTKRGAPTCISSNLLFLNPIPWTNLRANCRSKDSS